MIPAVVNHAYRVSYAVTGGLGLDMQEVSEWWDQGTDVWQGTLSTRAHVQQYGRLASAMGRNAGEMAIYRLLFHPTATVSRVSSKSRKVPF